MTKLKLTGLVFLIIILVTALAGCAGDSDESNPTSNATGSNGPIPADSEFVKNVSNASGNVKTSTIDMVMDMKMEAGSQGDADMSMNGSGVIDNLNKKMKMDMNIGMDMGFMDMDVETEVYFINNVIYTKIGEMAGMSEQWQKMQSPGGDGWESQDMITQQTDLLESAKLDISNGGVVNGADCYKVEITSNMMELYETMMGSLAGQGGSGFESGLPEDVDVLEFMEMVEEFSVTQWYAKDTFFPMKSEMDMKMTMTAEMMGGAPMDGDMDVDMSMTINFRNYNKPVSIVLPAAASDAVDMTEMINDGGWDDEGWGDDGWDDEGWGDEGWGDEGWDADWN